MQTEKDNKGIEVVPSYGGGHYEPLWQQEDNMSTYYSYTLDSQGVIPGIDIEKIKKDLGINS